MVRRNRLVVALVTLAALVLGSAATAAPRRSTPVGPDRTLTVMTRNVYFGADLGPVVDAALTGASVEDVVAAAAGAYVEAAQSDFPFRAEALADEVAATRPALVGVQESTVWEASPFTTEPSLLLNVDFLDLVLDELAERGLHYEVVAEVEGFDATLPLPVPGINALVTLTISDVLLRDASLPASDLHVREVLTGTYATAVPPLPLPGGLPSLPFPRQWIAADVVVRGVPARVVTTHLESVNGAVRVGQAAELLAGPAATDVPTIVMGDLNSEVDGVTDDPPLAGPVPDAAHLLVLNGFDDLGPAGLTCCQDSDLRNTTSDLSSRIDLVLGRGGFAALDGVVTGDEPLRPGSPGAVQYGSDHAGVTATVVLPR